ncbi:MAG: TonB-dependent siderophore receptor [Proteobacteria bacterium]|nr:MAG: TonB-dependent siderophore receptor [Pseudomonadota bacterium]
MPDRHSMSSQARCVETSRIKQQRRPRAALPAVVASALTTLALTHATAAEQDESTKALPTIRVQDTADDEFDYVSSRSRAGLRTDTPLIEVPQSISVIPASLIRDQNAQTMQEVLRYTAGVRTDMYGLDNRGDAFTLRGGSYGMTLLDGMRLPISGTWGIVRNEPFAFERIEVLRGPTSVYTGQNGPGGVVNMVSKRPTAESISEIALQFGNRDHKQVGVDFGGRVSADDTLLYRFVALGRDSDTQVDHAFEERLLVAPSLTWQPTASTALTLYGEYQEDESANIAGFFPWAGTLLPAPNGPIPTNTFIGEPDWDTYGGERMRLGYQFERRLGEAWTLRHDFRHERVSGHLRTMYTAWWEGFLDAQGNPDPDGQYLNRLWYAGDDEVRLLNANAFLGGRLSFGNVQHTLLMGVDAMSWRQDQKVWGDEPATPLNVYEPVYGTFPMPELDDIPFARQRTRQLGAVLQDQIKFEERWVVVAGLRHDWTESERSDNAFSKSLGLVYLGEGGWSPYLNYSESFQAVSGTDAAGEPFKPLRGRQYEAGVKWAPGTGRVMATGAVYRLEEENRLTTDPENPLESVQRGEITVEGVELEVAASLAAWDLIGHYTWTDARQSAVSEPDLRYLDKQLNSIPEHSAALWAVHRFDGYGLPGLRVGLGVRYLGETWDGTDTLATPSNTLLDALVSYDLGSWRMALNASNLTDKTYFATCLERGDCWIGARRKVTATLSYLW